MNDLFDMRCGQAGGDCTGPYYITLKRECTVREFMEYWMQKQQEWGYFGIDDGLGTPFGNPQCEYRYGEIITSPFPEEILNAKIRHVSGSGGWTRSDFLFKIENVPEKAEPTPTAEDATMDKAPEWIYAPLYGDPALEKTLAAVEKALGFKLFIWQKTFIERGVFRRSGATTAEILRDLLNVNASPLDYTRPPHSNMKRFYREETKNIKEKLDAAGIPTRTVFFSHRDKVEYTKKERNQP